MNKKIEEIIVKSFFNKRIQQRVLFELFSPSKRSYALSRLCHNYSITLCGKFMNHIPKPNSDPEEIERLLIKQGAQDICYVMSMNSSTDGEELDLKTAIEQSVGDGMPYLISCIHGKLAYFQAEQDYGAPQRFILKR
ncbi:hypothetical protein CN326_22760 [Bacillus sp. AFS018417]|uniref:hypothetical protein n=1 Tax=Bacillus sp. AFS018417 TaxID=2033491 RepID=UPI000BF754E5|nr:hypothetical protein [Bacillus sp. AFS018417]PEZ00309.1 hypothetical protein CN326_22760 [Bacillus sp. AFS018417]